MQNKLYVFLGITIGGIGILSSLHIDAYEYNQLINLGNSYSKLVLSADSYRKLEISKGTWFTYYLDQDIFMQKIINIEGLDNKYILMLSGTRHISPVTNISYKLDRKSILSTVLNL